VPPDLKPVRTDPWARELRAPTDYYEITHKEGKAEILPGLTTALWGYDGIFRGPTIESRSGRKIVVRYHNVYPLEQRAATLWYHDHRMDFTGPQIWRGLAGFHIVDDDEEDELPLPKDEKVVPLMVCDRAFGEGGSFLYPLLQGEPGVKAQYMEGVLGDAILVNCVPWPFMEVSNTRYRFRILNASNARRYRLVLDPGPSDGLPFVAHHSGKPRQPTRCLD
jgi:spore coat protein A, manganese oxidase